MGNHQHDDTNSNEQDDAFDTVTCDFPDTQTPEQLAAWESRHLEPLPESVLKEFSTFKVIRELGRGGFGRVYLAENHSSEIKLLKHVAVKLMHVGASEAELKRFENELSALRSLSHPGIVSLFDSGILEPNLAYLAMEYVDGLPIDDFCEHRSNDWQSCVKLVIQVCDSIEHAHSRGILHCDLKPSNILVTQGEKTVVTDFGLVRFFNETDDQTPSNWQGVRGTPAYMPPEQLEATQSNNSEQLTVAADIFGLGATLYKLVAGHPPRPARSTRSAIALTRAGETTTKLDRQKLRISCPEGLIQIIERATAPTPYQRYANVSQLREDLENLIAHRPLRAKPISQLHRFRLWVRREPLLAVSASLVLALLSICVLIAIGWARSETRKTQLLQSGFDESLQAIQDFQRTITSLRPGEGLTGNKRIEALRLIRNHYGNLANLDPNDFELRYKHAQASYILGSYLNDVGKLDESETEINSAIGEYEVLLKKGERVEQLQFDMFHAYHKLGHVEAALERSDRCHEHLTIAYRYISELVEQHPDNLNYADCQASQLLSMADFSEPELSDDEKRKLYLKAYKIATELRELPTSEPRHWRHRMGAYVGLASLAEKEGNFDETLSYYEGAIKFADQSLSAEPESWSHHLDKANTSTRLAIAGAKFDDQDVSQNALERSEESYQFLKEHCSALESFKSLERQRAWVRRQWESESLSADTE